MSETKPEIRHRVTLDVRGTLDGLMGLVHDLPDEVPNSAEVVSIATYSACPDDILALESDPDVDQDDIPDHDPEAWLLITLEWA